MMACHAFLVPSAPRAVAPLYAAVNKQWHRECEAYIKRNGMILSGVSWLGYKAWGPGCVMATSKYRDLQHQQSPEALKYVPMSTLENPESTDMEMVRDTVKSYDPEVSFILVFQHKDMCGAEVVTPSISPAKISEMEEFKFAMAPEPTGDDFRQSRPGESPWIGQV